MSFWVFQQPRIQVHGPSLSCFTSKETQLALGSVSVSFTLNLTQKLSGKEKVRQTDKNTDILSQAWGFIHLSLDEGTAMSGLPWLYKHYCITEKMEFV